MHDYFACIVGQQVHVRPDSFAVAVVASHDDHFEVGSVFLFPVLFVEEFRGEEDF